MRLLVRKKKFLTGLPAETLFTLSLVDATPTQVCLLGNGDDGESLGFNPVDGLLYHASGLVNLIFEKIDIIQTKRGSGCVTTNIPVSQDIGEANALTFWETEGIFLWAEGFGGDRLFRLTVNGVETLVGPLDHRSKGLALLPAIITGEIHG